MQILVVGVGYVGLVTGACFSEMGHHVTCLDIDANKIENLQRGRIPIYEPFLQEIVQRNLSCHRLHFTTDYPQAVSQADICFLAVNTPCKEDGSCDLSAVMKASKEIAKHINKHKIIVNKSTVPVGTNERIRQNIQEELDKRENKNTFDMVSNPEFLKEGDAVNDFMKPDRIIIGVSNERSEKIMREIYRSFTLNRERMLVMDIYSAELAKYACNAMLATRISFMNELSGLCEKLRCDITQIRKAMGSDRRIGNSFLYAGPGYGGSCFPKDLKALQATAKQARHSSDIIDAVEKVNQKQKRSIAGKILQYFEQKKTIEGKTLAILGLAFKPNTDDVRESPALTLIDQLCEFDCLLRLYDPIAMENAKKQITPSPRITYCESELEAALGADALVLVTEWKPFRFMDLKKIQKAMKGSAFFDCRNQYKPKKMQEHGFDYISIGRAACYAFNAMEMV